jgi:hypothetical protein
LAKRDDGLPRKGEGQPKEDKRGWEETEGVRERQKVTNEEVAVEIVGTREHRCEGQGRTVAFQNPLKRRTMDSAVQETPKERTFGRYINLNAITASGTVT